MGLLFSRPDVLHCDLCETPVPPMYCDLCLVKLCKACVGEHLSDETKSHKVVSYEKRGSTPQCPKHSPRVCELYCELCNIPICSLCVSSGEHEQHSKVDILETFETKKTQIKKDQEKIQKSIFPKFKEIASNIQVQKDDVKKHSQRLVADVDKRGEIWHRELGAVIESKKSEIATVESELLSALDKEEGEVNEKMSEVRERIFELEELTNSRNVYNVAMYTSLDETFESSLAQLHVALPRFCFRDINREALEEQFGSLSPIYNVRIPEGASNIQPKALLDEPKFTQVMKTQYTEINKLRSVSSLKDDEVWTCGQDKVMRLYNLQGQVIRSYHTKSGERPEDIAVMQGGDLLYSDYNGRTVHQVKGGIIETTISLRKWRPRGICSTASGDVLVIMDSDDQQSKIVHYSGSTEKHSIQWDDQDKPLLSPAGLFHTKYLCENRNWDICVADRGASAVVVVSAVGKLRFRYTGPLSTVDESFDPVGIATDSQARILVADCDNHRIHILNQHGHFLRYIEDPDLCLPRGLCVDSRDTLLVAEATTGKVKKINYNS
uniref:E3 ubiquitin-protein ligase TRIM71-like n=1 Tax=Crassostrea virginica TaxID=6565 RepID=A0A8B8BGG0_CRAVI|nr:E3 ubiquitin-protein ligase TRIM71-like [Crassostrea virginica]